ncbi:MAG: EF-P lysine aminoacylase GenX [Bauldia sp.]|nr:EF-P lysine aminoacylase GenX [Bauldia sp.]
MTVSPSPWWDRGRHRDRRARLLLRNRIAAAVRAWFAAEGFVEVEPAALQTSPGNELHLHGFETRIEAADGRSAPLHLHTSPEFAMKKLLAAGETRIFALAQVFRNRERSALHAPSFTMLEWYRAGAPYEAVMADCAALIALAAKTAEATAFRWREASIDPALPPERITVAEALAHHAGIDLLATIPADGAPNRAALADAAQAAGIRVAPDDSWMDIFGRVLGERVEPALGRGRATLLTEYPAPAAALARRAPADPRVAERFELFACGVELANGFGELTDAAEQRRRFAAEMAEKERLYGRRAPVDEDFLAALSAMPPASGVALGFDRLAMLAAGAERVEDVQWTPVVDPFA